MKKNKFALLVIGCACFHLNAKSIDGADSVAYMQSPIKAEVNNFQISSSELLQATCPKDGVISITSQKQIDNFKSNYPGCDHSYNLYISGNDITNLNGFSGIKNIKSPDSRSGSAAVVITDTSNLTSLSGLNVRIQGNLTFENNSGFKSGLTGLSDSVIIGSATIESNPNLKSLSGLKNGFLYHLKVSSNPNLTQCATLLTCSAYKYSDDVHFYSNPTQCLEDIKKACN